LKLAGWRIRVMKDRIAALEEYISYRKKLDEKLRKDRRTRDWLVRACLWIRRRVNRFVLGAWLRLLTIRREFWEVGKRC
jgi:hypothetical protein